MSEVEAEYDFSLKTCQYWFIWWIIAWHFSCRKYMNWQSCYGLSTRSVQFMDSCALWQKVDSIRRIHPQGVALEGIYWIKQEEKTCAAQPISLVYKTTLYHWRGAQGCSCNPPSSHTHTILQTLCCLVPYSRTSKSFQTRLRDFKSTLWCILAWLE